MAELLVRTVSKVNPTNAHRDAKLTKRGDVIMVCPDGWGWCGDELKNPHWRILKWPSITVSEASLFMSREIQTATNPFVGIYLPDPLLQARGYHLNLDHGKLPSGLRKYLDDETRKEPFFVMPADFDINDIKVKKTKRIDPHLIG